MYCDLLLFEVGDLLKQLLRIIILLMIVILVFASNTRKPHLFQDVTSDQAFSSGLSEHLGADYSTYPWGDWKHYHNYSEIVNTLFYLNLTYPDLVDLFSIGKSWQNRDIYCIRLTNENITRLKPKVFFVGYHHAREPISAELPLYFTVKATTNFSTSEILAHMLNYSEIYIVPALNVDAFDVVQANEWQRKNVHPFNEDDDGQLDEDPPDDEDGDGYIENLCYNGDDYEFIRWEGIDDDGDGLLNEDWIGGVDLNRNYGYQWDATCQSGSPDPKREDYRGLMPFSEPETQAIRDLALQHDFEYAISFHSGAESVAYPWGYTTTPSKDRILLNEIASQLSSLVGGCWYGQAGSYYTTSGLWDDWMYQNRSTFAFTCEIYTNSSAWQYEPGPEQGTFWERGVFQYFNPNPDDIEVVIQRWLPVFNHLTNRAITEAYDLATIEVNPQKTIVGQGFPMDINVTVANQGDFTENSNITVYVDTTSIASKEITLPSKSSTIITFLWNTTNLVKGYYTITSYAKPVSGETEITDNEANCDVYVGIPGDLNADGTADDFDASILEAVIGTTPKHLEWNPNADINSDLIIDVFDAVILAGHAGET